MPYYTYIICNYWVINKIFVLNIIYILILLLSLPKIIKYNKIRYRVLNKFAKNVWALY